MGVDLVFGWIGQKEGLVAGVVIKVSLQFEFFASSGAVKASCLYGS